MTSCTSLYAGEDSKDLMDMSLEELMELDVTIGSNIKGLSQNDVPAAVYRITGTDIRQTGARHLGEALTILVPGFMWIFDEDDYIFAFRGLTQDNNSSVVLKVNGQDVGYHYNYGLASQMSSLDLNHIERVDIIIGPGGADNGAGPLMGSINVITTGFEEEGSYCQTGIDVGTGNLTNIHGAVHHDNGGDLKLHLNLASYQQKGGFSAKQGDGNWIIPDGTTGGGGVQTHGRYMQILPSHNIYGRAEYKEYEFSFFHTNQYFDPYEKDTDVYQHYITQGSQLERDFQLTTAFSINTQVWYKRVGGWIRNGIKDTNLGWDIQEGEVNYGTQLTAQYNKGRWKTAFGGRVNHYDYGENPFTGRNEQRMTAGTTTIYDLDGNPYPLPSDRMTASAGNFSINDSDLFIEAHYRLNDQHRFLASAVYSHADARNNDSVSPRIAYFGTHGSFKWKLFYTRAYKSVMDASTLQLDPGAFFRHYTSEDLKQQKIDNLELNINHTKGPLYAELRTFYTINRDVIQGGGSDLALSDPCEAAKYWWTFVNAGQVDNWGLEAMLRADLSEQWTVGASHALVRVARLKIKQDTDLFVSSAQQTFLNYPEDVTRLYAIYKPHAIPGLTIRSDFLIDYGRLQGDPVFSDASTASNQKSDNWYNLNLGFLYDIKGWQFDAHVYNLLNSRPYQPVMFRNQYASTPSPCSWRIGVSRVFEF